MLSLLLSHFFILVGYLALKKKEKTKHTKNLNLEAEVSH